MEVKAKRITPESFARFGRVVGRPRGTPTAQAREPVARPLKSP